MIVFSRTNRNKLRLGTLRDILGGRRRHDSGLRRLLRSKPIYSVNNGSRLAKLSKKSDQVHLPPLPDHRRHRAVSSAGTAVRRNLFGVAQVPVNNLFTRADMPQSERQGGGG